MILLIDNYDSFVYNIARYVNELGFDCVVKRNDQISMADITALQPTHMIISPGPLAPDQAGISLAAIHTFAPKIPILGVCLGHQAIGQAFGAMVRRANNPMHGKSSRILHDQRTIFQGMPPLLTVGRYHSLIVSEANFPTELRVIARCEAGEVMAISHQRYPTYGVQFHPESVLTECGHQLIENFLLRI